MLRLRRVYSLVSFSLMGVLGLPFLAHAQVPSEDELFGTPEPEKAGDKKPEAKDEKSGGTNAKEVVASTIDYGSQLIDNMQIGGRLEIRANANKVDEQKFQKSPYNQNKTADIYFDTRPNKDVRAFLRLRFFEDNSQAAASDEPVSTTEQTGVSTISNSIDELWLKWDIDDTLFVTAGKQHVKWGRGRFWNPIDFTAREVKDPFALFDRRLGQEMIKLHLPFEKSGHNFYLIAQFDDTLRNDDVGFAARAEFSVGENGEFAVSAQSKRDRALKVGVDTGFGVGNFDFGIESAWLTRDNKPRYRGDLDIPTFQFPSEDYDEKRVYNQTVLNIEYVWKYNDDDNLNLGLEGMWNEMGYDARILEFYSLLNGTSKVLYAGKQYVAAYARLSAPGDWNDSSFILNAVQNISDQTAQARLTATYTFYKQITAELYVSRCFGDYGELCFRVPDSIIQGAANLPPEVIAGVSTLSPNTLVALNSLPRKVTRTVFGGSLMMNF
ncbi:MAG: hypothetical protein EOP10_15045 [Proteobacteria bacterium]|nr:MAG: hypothetical protein EOP10_15045 [Pseudomonadota bacterium]